MRFESIAGCLALGGVLGCGPSAPTFEGTRPPHNGTVVVLPGDLGNVEVVREDVADQPGRSKLWLYFIDQAGKPLARVPTAATLKPRERGAAPVSMQPTAATDPSKAGAWESPVIPAGGDIEGELSVTIQGKPVAVPLIAR